MANATGSAPRVSPPTTSGRHPRGATRSSASAPMTARPSDARVVRRAARQTAHDSGLERRRELDAADCLVQRYRGPTEQLLEQLARRAPAEGVYAGEQPIRDRGEAEDVGPAIDQLPRERLGGHVLERPHEEAGAGE